MIRADILRGAERREGQRARRGREISRCVGRHHRRSDDEEKASAHFARNDGVGGGASGLRGLGDGFVGGRGFDLV